MRVTCLLVLVATMVPMVALRPSGTFAPAERIDEFAILNGTRAKFPKVAVPISCHPNCKRPPPPIVIPSGSYDFFVV